ncbi:MAG: UDP-N-acetylmuramate dehydrogenase [Deltaproteobacteria bacterium]|jgi:UDP-N-acetylmuramate dehydrogenase|nr:UDP-N-acetylmuramate dehydrogenase [Deltaproteobacteria bacterium]
MIHSVAEPELRALTTLRLGGRAVALVSLETESDLEVLPDVLQRLGGRPMVIGRGSNILADDRALPFVLIRPDFRQGPEIVAQESRQVRVRAGAGLPLPRLLAWAAKRGLSGLEGLAGVPGVLGGGVAMNAGSYGCELGPILAEIRVFTVPGGVRRLLPGEFSWRYRELDVPALAASAWWMACGADLVLTVDDPARIRLRMAQNLARKKASQPVRAHSAGCVFKNPEGLSAGKLLDEAGFRGKRLGGMAFSDLHANFLVNTGGGESAAALELLENARAAVAERHGITLQTEVKLWLSS